MSVYLIEYENGAKVMRPVLSREKYLELRGLAVHKDRVEQIRTLREMGADSEEIAAVKKKLLQFNYSCIPSEDRLLKGCKQMSTSVGIDVDHIPADEMEATKERILAKKDEIGLLMLERSVRCEGYHIVCKRVESLSQEDNIKHIADILQVEPDMGAKDITRVFFATTASPEDLLYINDELFKVEACKEEVKSEKLKVKNPDYSSSDSQGNKSASPGTSPHPSPKERGNVNTPSDSADSDSQDNKSASPWGRIGGVVPSGRMGGASGLRAFDLCCEAAGLDPQKMDIWGVHNWHSNLMAVLSVGLPKLMSREQLMAVVAERLPNYSQTADCRSLIDYFYEKYSADKGYMTTSLREINAQAQMMSAEDEATMEQLTHNWNPPAPPKKLPRIIHLMAGNFDPRFREMLMLASLPILSAHASHFRARYLSGRLTPPQQYVAVIGGSGSGKGNNTRLFEQACQYTLIDHDSMEWKKVAENSRERDKKTNAKERPEKYHPKLRVFMTTSKSSMQELQNNCGENGMLLGVFSEVDELFNGNMQSYANLSVTLRKGWDGDLQSQYYLSDATICAQTRTNIALLMCGTPNAMLKRMLADTESGFLQRCIPVIVPNRKRTFRPPKEDYLTHDEKIERDALIMSLYQKDLALGDGISELKLPKTLSAIGKWFDELEELYNDGMLSEAEADLSHRCGEFMLRAAIPLVALEGQESKAIVDFAVWVGRTAFYYLCRMFGARVSRDLAEASQLLSPKDEDHRRTAEPLLDKVPEVFTMKQFQEVRVSAGQSENCAMLLKRYVDNGKIQRVGRGVYQKAPKPENNIIT